MNEIDTQAADKPRDAHGVAGPAEATALPQLEPDRPWPSALDERVVVERNAGWEYALNFTDRHSSESIEHFILAEQTDHLGGVS